MMTADEIQTVARQTRTDERIVEAIDYVTQGGKYGQFEKVWENPTEREMHAIWEYATQNGLDDDTLMFWGDTTLFEMSEGMM